MSTAIGHGLADPKRRGKPVSYANKGRRVLHPRRGRVCEGMGSMGLGGEVQKTFFQGPSYSNLYSLFEGEGIKNRTYADRRIERESG